MVNKNSIASQRDPWLPSSPRRSLRTISATAQQSLQSLCRQDLQTLPSCTSVHVCVIQSHASTPAAVELWSKCIFKYPPAWCQVKSAADYSGRASTGMLGGCKPPLSDAGCRTYSRSLTRALCSLCLSSSCTHPGTPQNAAALASKQVRRLRKWGIQADRDP